MTDYHPVTKEELEQIRSGCDATKMMDEVISRPDPLALLEAWITNGNDIKEGVYLEISGDGGLLDFIKLLRTNPSAVREQGIKEGWLP
jgi:hypothetical protein